MVDFRCGSTGIMYTVDRQDWKVDVAVVATFAGHNVNSTCPASACSRLIAMPALMLGKREDGMGIICDARTTP
jgi:hypothetical protein